MQYNVYTNDNNNHIMALLIYYKHAANVQQVDQDHSIFRISNKYFIKSP